jgi:hypothetical protein
VSEKSFRNGVKHGPFGSGNGSAELILFFGFEANAEEELQLRELAVYCRRRDALLKSRFQLS